MLHLTKALCSVAGDTITWKTTFSTDFYILSRIKKAENRSRGQQTEWKLNYIKSGWKQDQLAWWEGWKWTHDLYPQIP